jgi:hypothetical protein
MEAIRVDRTNMQKGSKLHSNLIEFIMNIMGTFRFAVILWKTTRNYKITGRHMWYMLITREQLQVGRPEYYNSEFLSFMNFSENSE